MVASEHEEVLRVFDFVGEHEADGFDRLFSSVNIVAKEEVVGISGKSCVLEELDEIGVLSMDVTCIKKDIPQILIGASSSKSIGCSKNISLAFRQRPLISDSRSFTSLPPFSRSLLMILSTSTS